MSLYVCLMKVHIVLTNSSTELSSLRHVRELRADGNTITSLEGLEELDGLVKLSLKGNKITHVNFEEVRWCVSFYLNRSFPHQLKYLTGRDWSY